jgi:hypothetical protein
MPSAYATKVAEGFSAKLIRMIYENAPIDEVVNRDYEGEINAIGSKLNILTLTRISEKTYTGANLSPDDLTEINAQLVIDQKKAFYWREKTIDRWASYIKQPKGTVLEQTANERKKNIMKFLMGFYSKAGAGNWYGTDYTTGTVAIDVSGNVTGSGTTFTSSMVGRPFQAAGHTKWYRVVTYTDATHIVIQNDTDDDVAAYDGGVISAGATYTVQAATVLTVDNSAVHFLDMITALKEKLDIAEVPDEDRFIFLPPAGVTRLLKDPNIKLNVPAAYEDLIVKGLVTELEGFKIFKVNRLTGDNVNGFYILAGQRNFLTYADKPLEVGMEEDLIGNFGSAYKDLFVYGAKVTDERRKFGATAFVKFA